MAVRKRPNPRLVPSSTRSARSATNPFLSLLTAQQHEHERRLRTLLDEHLRAVRPLGGEVQALVREVRRLALRGGKRLRPALVAAGFRVVSDGGNLEPALAAGVALELLHTYFLIHDDWMDGDRVRRGGPSVHVALAQRFGSRQRGDTSAILAGDYAVGLACEALSRLQVRPERLREAYAAFADMQLSAVAGQQLDMQGGGRNVELVYALKTSSYTVEGPLRLGAVLAGARPATLSALSRYARPAGIAFQLRDDLLSLFGDPAETGKPLASDLTQAKQTLLLRWALRGARPPEMAAINRVLGKPSAKLPQLRAALAAIQATGAPERVEKRIQELSRRALAELGQGVGARGRELLTGATEALLLRQS